MTNATSASACISRSSRVIMQSRACGVRMIDRVASWIRAAERVVVLTGAGISAESGVPVFRGPGGLWRQFRPEDLATPEAFRAPARARVGVVPVAARADCRGAAERRARRDRALAAVARRRHAADAERRRPARAGGQRAIRSSCTATCGACAARRGCGYTARDREADATARSAALRCGAWLRPDVVWFGEPLDAEVLRGRGGRHRAARTWCSWSARRRWCIRWPALPQLARRRGARVVEVNVDETPLSAEADAVLRGPAGEVLPALEQAL